MKGDTVYLLINDYRWSNDNYYIEGSDVINVFENEEDAVEDMHNMQREFCNDCDAGKHEDFINYSIKFNKDAMSITIISAKAQDLFERYYILQKEIV